jgi:hypothetical protein
MPTFALGVSHDRDQIPHPKPIVPPQSEAISLGRTNLRRCLNDALVFGYSLSLEVAGQIDRPWPMLCVTISMVRRVGHLLYAKAYLQPASIYKAPAASAFQPYLTVDPATEATTLQCNRTGMGQVFRVDPSWADAVPDVRQGLSSGTEGPIAQVNFGGRTHIWLVGAHAQQPKVRHQDRFQLLPDGLIALA